ncbi:MAG: hypothetical protein Q9172_001355 [Xanthocarpia lactea]
MPIEKSLPTLLRALQSASSQQDISRYLVPRNRFASELTPGSLLGSAARLLALLSNPSNVTLLTSQILAAPVIWGPSTNLQIIVGVITLFRTASYHLLRLHDVSHTPKPLEAPRSLGLEEWTTAIVIGTDGASPRARQVLVLSGLLQGSQSRARNGLSTRLQDDLLISVNLSLRKGTSGSHIIDRALVIAVSQVFDFLDIRARHTLDHDLLLPTLIEAVFFSEDGIHQGYFLGTIDADVSEAADRKFDWSARSTSYLQLQSTASVPSSAVQMLKVLRNLYFISSHLGTDTLSQYSFVYLAAIDIVSQYPMIAEALLGELRPNKTGVVPQHPLDRCLDIYFLNTAEHFISILDTEVADNLVASAALPYLGASDEQRSLEAFEAAHSVTLAILAVPHNSHLAASRIETYINVLFEAFPQSLSPRQFRLALTQLVRITSPPSPVSAQRPLLSSALLEIVRIRIEHASAQPLATFSKDGEFDAQPISEQAVLVIALIHSLPFLQLDVLEDWLPVAARLCHLIHDPVLRHVCKQRFWDVLSNGEMDLDRAALCANWWNTGKGREMLLYGEEKTTPGSPINDGLDASRL